MKYCALFNHNPKGNIVNELGFNLNQRLYYQTHLELLDVNHDFSYLKYLWQQAVHGEELCIVTERSYHSIFGLFFSLIFKHVYWIYDTPDCPLKEAESLYKKYTFKWLKSTIKGYAVYLMLPLADLIIINYSPKRFKRFFKGSLAKVHFFKNALPNLPTHRTLTSIPFNNKKLTLIYVGAGQHAFGLESLFEALASFNQKSDLKAELNIYGHRSDISKPSVTYHGHKTRQEVLTAIKNADICVSPILKGTDIEFVYSVKTMEYYCYGKKMLISDTTGMLEQFSGIQSKDIYFSTAGSSKDIENKLHQIVIDLKNEITDKKRDLSPFSAEMKNEQIKDLYMNIAKVP